MPIRPENRARYPADWTAISKRIRFERAQGQCECPGGAEGCGLHRGRRCAERHGEPAKFARGKVILTTMHLDHAPETCDPSNLRAACQTCHNRYDAAHRRAGIVERRDAAAGQTKLAFPAAPAGARA